jgi:hypothetical protein
VHVDAVRGAQRQQVVLEDLPLGVAHGQPALVDGVVAAVGLDRDREGQLDVPGGDEDADVDRLGVDTALVDQAQRLADGDHQGLRGVADHVDADVWCRERLRQARGQAHHGRLGFAAGGGRGGDPRRAALADVGEETVLLEDAQGLADGAALHAELLGEFGLGGQPVPRLELTGTDAFPQDAGDLLGRGSSAAVHCHVLRHALLGHDQTLQL